MKAVFPPVILGLMRISLAFQANANVCFAVFCKFLSGFWGCSGREDKYNLEK